eukprot:529482-Rhodomonas_salina.1
MGPFDEVNQSISFLLVFDSGDSALFASPPAIDATGALVLDLASKSGWSRWNVTGMDDGGGLNTYLYKLPLEIRVIWPPPAVEDLHVAQVSETSIVVSWEFNSDHLTNLSTLEFTLLAEYDAGTVTQNLTSDDCNRMQCSVSLSVQKGWNVAVQVKAFNSGGLSDPSEVSLLIVGQPSQPTAVTADQNANSLLTGHVSLTWVLADFGDFKGAGSSGVVIVLYEFSVLCDDVSDSTWALQTGGADTSDVTLSLQWTTEQQQNLTISDPSGVLSLKCDRGSTVSFSLRANNTHYAGPWSESIDIQLLGVPSDVLDLTADELEDSILLVWNKPLDTGYGDATETLTNYIVEWSLCDMFDSASHCSTFVDVVSTSEGEQYSITKLPSAGVYYIRVSAENGNGYRPSDQIIQQSFQISPTILAPALPVYVTFSSGSAHVWADGSQASEIIIEVQGFPSDVVASSDLTLTYSDGEGTTSSGTVSFVQVTQSAVAISITPPTGSAGGTSVIVVASVSKPWKSVQFNVVFFDYQSPVVLDLYPTVGSENGGTAMLLTVTDYTGARTRYGAGLASVVGASVDRTLGVRFECDANTAVATSVSPSVSFGISSATIAVTLQVPTSPCTAGEGRATVVLMDGSEEIAFEVDGDRPLEFEFKGARIESLTPGNGMTFPGSGGIEVTASLADVGALYAVKDVRLGHSTCEILQVTSLSTGGMILRFRTPELHEGLAGVLDLLIHGNVANFTSTWEYLAPPAMQIVDSSIQVEGQQQHWIPLGIQVNLVFEISSLSATYGRTFDELQVRIGSTQTVVIQPQIIGDSVTVSVNADTSSLTVGMHSLSVDVNEGGVTKHVIDSMSTGELAKIEIRDLSQPGVVAFAPSELPTRGGTVVAIGISGADRILSQASGTTVSGLVVGISTGGVERQAEVLGAVSVSDWAVAMAQTQLWNAILQTSDALVSEFEAVVADTLDSESTGSSFVQQVSGFLLLKTPALTADGLATVVLTVDGDMFLNFTIPIVAAPSGSASIEAAKTDTGDASYAASGGGRLDVTLSNFPLVYHISQIEVMFGPIQGQVLRLLQSDKQSTSIYILVPASDAGEVEITITAVAGTSSFFDGPSGSVVGAFSFLFIDDDVPEVVFFSQNQVYADGGSSVMVQVYNMPSTVSSSEDVSIVIATPSGGSFSITPTSLTSISATVHELVFATPSSSAGVHVLHVSAGGKTTETFEMDFIAVPTSAPSVRSITPGTGGCATPETEVTVKLTGMRKLAVSADLQVKFGSADPVSRGSGPEVLSVQSSFTLTTVRFIPPAVLDVGNTAILLWSLASPELIGNATFWCIDSSLAK